MGGGGRAVWFWVTVAGLVTLCSATLASMLVLSGGAEKFIRVMTSYPPAPDRICNIPTIDQWLCLDYLFTRTVSWRLVHRWPCAAAVPVLPVAAFQTGSFPPVHLPWAFISNLYIFEGLWRMMCFLAGTDRCRKKICAVAAFISLS